MNSHDRAAATIASPGPTGLGRHALLSFLWLVFNFEWGALLIVMPPQIALIGGEAQKVHNVGIILPLGALVSLLVTPIAGALSDRSKSPLGRRSAYLLGGGLLNLVFLAAMARFGAGSSLVWFTLCWLGLQLGANWWGAPYAGMIPDQVPRGERGAASGWMMAMTSAGVILGSGLAAALLRFGYAPTYAAIGVLLAAGIALTIFGVREWNSPPAHRSVAARPFFPGLAEYRDFWLVLVTRTCMTMGSFTILPFFAFFLRGAFALPSDEAATGLFGALLATTSILAIPAALLGGRWADRNGPLRAVRLGGWITAACAVALALLALHPGMTALILVAFVLAQGSALYQAVDWALAIAVLPGLGDAGRYMGIWHISFVLPQMIAPFLASLILGIGQSGGATHPASSYVPLFLLAALWSACGTLPLRFIRTVR
jgi:MFS family permease